MLKMPYLSDHHLDKVIELILICLKVMFNT